MSKYYVQLFCIDSILKENKLKIVSFTSSNMKILLDFLFSLDSQ